MSKNLSESRYLADLFTKDPVQASFLRDIINAINNVAKGSGVAVNGDLQPPPPVNAISIKASGEQIHATLTHGAEVNRNINYFIEADTSPSFTQPHTMDIGASRSHIFNLPTFNDAGTPNKWYLRTYAQYPGSKPSAPTVLGGLANPTAIQLHGLTKLSLLPPTGSGTASTTGQQGGSGRGKQRISTPKVIRLGKKQASNTPVVTQALAAHITTGSTPAVGVDVGPFSFTTTTTSVTFTWPSFNLYRNDGVVQAMVPSPTGGISITGLSANTQYFFYPYFDELAQVIAWASGGVGSPSYAFTAVSALAAQQQNLVTNVPLSSGGIAVTTPATGTGGGSGGGGGHCFTGETRVKTPWGWRKFQDLPRTPMIDNENGTFLADLIVHNNCNELVIPLGPGRVNLIHGLRIPNGEWKKAGEVFPDTPRTLYKGTLYNLHVRSENEADHHYIVEPDWVAHNFFPVK